MEGIIVCIITYEKICNTFINRVNLKYPIETTIQQFYENFNYGVFWSNQMQTALFMEQVQQQRNLNTETTVEVIKNHITTQFIDLSRGLHNVRAFCRFADQLILVSISTKIQNSYAQCATWLEINAVKYIIDFHNLVLDEAFEDMIFFDGDAGQENNNNALNDDNDENKDKYL